MEVKPKLVKWVFHNPATPDEDYVLQFPAKGWRDMSIAEQNSVRQKIHEAGINMGAYPDLLDYQLVESASYPHPSLVKTYQPGCTEPHIAELVCALLKASGQTDVVELGGYIGTTSAWLACTLQQMGGGRLRVVEWDPEAPERADKVQERLEGLGDAIRDVQWEVIREDSIKFLRAQREASVGFAFVDDDHSHAHVDEELQLLLGLMVPGGIISGHDVVGSCDLQQEFKRYGGIGVDLPRFGPAGGLGIISIPR